jgi:antitoxin component HigA of HigAB toxin-antitoxin module
MLSPLNCVCVQLEQGELFRGGNGAENEVYLAEVSKLMQIGEDLSPAEEKLLRLLVALIEIFEDQQYQLNPATPLEILKELMGVGASFPSENRSLKQQQFQIQDFDRKSSVVEALASDFLGSFLGDVARNLPSS